MQTIYPNLDQEIRGLGLSYARLAKEVGLSKSAIYRRISGQTDFKLTEVVHICQFLENLDATWLFLRLDIIS